MSLNIRIGSWYVTSIHSKMKQYFLKYKNGFKLVLSLYEYAVYLVQYILV